MRVADVHAPLLQCLEPEMTCLVVFARDLVLSDCTSELELEIEGSEGISLPRQEVLDNDGFLFEPYPKPGEARGSHVLCPYSSQG